MPRTLDSIVACHRASRERITARRPVWDRSISLADLSTAMREAIAAGQNAEIAAAAACQAIADRLRQKLPATWFEITHADYDPILDDTVEALDGTTADEFADETCGTATGHLRAHLDALYDWADGKRIWLGR